MPVTYLRPTRVEGALGKLGAVYVYGSGLAALTPDSAGTDLNERTGMELANLYVADVDTRSPEYLAGLRTGDRMLSAPAQLKASQKRLGTSCLFVSPAR